MSNIIHEARSKMPNRAQRMVGGDKPGNVDASDYTPEPLDVESDEKNSGQPNNARMRYKRGGAVGKSVGVEGDKPKQNAGKKPRSGNKMRHDDATEDKKLIDKIVKPEARRDARAVGGAPGWYKPGQYVDGGTRKSLEMGDAAREAVKGLPHKKENGIMVPARDKRAGGGGLYANIHAKQERIAHGSDEKMRKPGAKGAPTKSDFEKSERTARSAGGDLALGAASPAGLLASKLLKDGGRTERASGGRTKGKTNINIIIGAGGKPAGAPPMQPPIGAALVAPPPDGALPSAGPMPAAPPPMGPPAGGMPMPRKDGGRTIKMEYGAGGGKGRLQKKDWY